MLCNRAHLAAAALLLGASAASQQPWYLRPEAGAPAVAAPSAAVDTARNVAVVVGALANDTLEWDGTNWNRIVGAVSPLAGMPIVGDGAGVLGIALGATWRFDGSSWAQIGSSAPTATGAKLVFDSARNVVVAFGGVESIFSLSDDTWEWNGSAWILRTPANRPPSRQRHALAFDPSSNRVVLFGGQSSLGSNASVLGDTWTWDGGNWTQETPAASPPGRARHAMVSSPEGDGVLLTGGADGTARMSNIWRWQGSNWEVADHEGFLPAWADHTAFPNPNGSGFAVYASELSTTGIEASLVVAERREPRPSAGVTYTSIATTGTPPPVTDHSFTAKGGGGFLVFGGRDALGLQRATYTLDGSAWTRQFSTLNPIERDGHQVVLDAQGRNLLFGGRNPAGTVLSDTWHYANGQWSFLQPAQSPPPRHRHAMASDQVADRAYLFGGLDAAGQPLDDFWLWDGTDWTQLQAASNPPARSGHGLAFDADRRVLVLYGGRDAQGVRSDVWEWDGVRWTDVSAAQRPSARHGAQLAFDSDRGRLVMFGGRNPSGFLNDTWDARSDVAATTESWARVLRNDAGPTPSARNSGTFVHRPGSGAVLFGGLVGASPTTATSDTWVWSGDRWDRASPARSPASRWGHSMAYDSRRDRIVLFGGFTESPVQASGETWEWDGSTWELRSAAGALGARTYPMMTFDSARGRTVLFGGANAAGNQSNETWIWDGNTWSRANTARRPAPRMRAGFAYLPRIGAAVLFGGGNGSATFQDTWLFDGQDWSQVSTTTTPPARWDTRAVYDSVRQTVLLHGGADVAYTQNLDDLWQFDGADWSLLTPSQQPGGEVGPGPREDFGIAFDGSSGRTIVFQGSDGQSCLNDAWAWSGLGWTELVASANPPAGRSFARIAYDARNEQAVSFGGECSGTLMQDTWSIDVQPFGRHSETGPGCSGGGLSPRVGPVPGSNPVLGGSMRLQLSDLPSGNQLPAFLFVGFTRFPLPLDLTAFGLAGCRLYAASDLTYPAARSGSFGFVNIALPSDASYLGLRLETQGVAFVPGANSAGLLTTNGLSVRIGEL